MNKYSYPIFADCFPANPTEAWRMMNRVYWHLRNQGAPIEARHLVDQCCADLFLQMNQEAA